MATTPNSHVTMTTTCNYGNHYNICSQVEFTGVVGLQGDHPQSFTNLDTVEPTPGM